MSRPVRVASVLQGLSIGGDENRLLHQLRHTDRAQVHHTVVVAAQPAAQRKDVLGPILGRYHRAGVPVVDLGAVPFRERRRLPKPLALARGGVTGAQLVTRLVRVLRQARIDVLDARLAMGALLAVPAGRALRLPVVATDYGVHAWTTPARWVVGQAVWGGLDTLVSDSQARLDEMRGWTLRPPRGAHVPNGIPAPAPERAAAEVWAELGWPAAGGPVIGQVARLVDFKGQRRLLRAMPHVLRAVPDARLLLCGYHQGRAGYRAELDQIIAQLGLADRVRVVSYPGAVGDLWQLIDVHCHPTHLDSSPIALMEAMATGRPSVATRVGGIPELIEDGRTGRLLPADVGPEGIAQALVPLLQSPARRASLGQAAQARWRAHHQPEAMAAHMAQIYRQVAQRHGRL